MCIMQPYQPTNQQHGKPQPANQHQGEISGHVDGNNKASMCLLVACKRKDTDMDRPQNPGPKKPRLVFTDIQRRTLLAIFKETRRPTREMQVTIAEQLGLKVSTVANFFMNARRRSLDKYRDDSMPDMNMTPMNSPMPPMTPMTPMTPMIPPHCETPGPIGYPQ